MNFDLSNPNTQQYLGAIIRTAIVLAGGGAVFTGDQISAGAGALAVLAGLIWSLIQKKNTVNHDVLEKAVNAAAANPTNAATIIAQAKAGKF